MLDVAACVSGKENCGVATMEEIEVLIGALKNPSPVVRDAGLRGLSAIVDCFPTYENDYGNALRVNKYIWITRFDVNEETRYV